MKTQQEYIEQGEQYILKTYNRFPVVLEKGEGVYLYDADQKKYGFWCRNCCICIRIWK